MFQQPINRTLRAANPVQIATLPTTSDMKHIDQKQASLLLYLQTIAIHSLLFKPGSNLVDTLILFS